MPSVPRCPDFPQQIPAIDFHIRQLTALHPYQFSRTGRIGLLRNFPYTPAFERSLAALVKYRSGCFHLPHRRRVYLPTNLQTYCQSWIRWDRWFPPKCCRTVEGQRQCLRGVETVEGEHILLFEIYRNRGVEPDVCRTTSR